MNSCGTYADGIIALAYLCVGFALVYVGIKRPDLAKSWIVWFFSPVFALCGAGHAAHFFSIWHDWAHLAVIYAMYAQAIAAIPAVIALHHVVQHIITSVSREQYEAKRQEAINAQAANRELENAITELRTRMLGAK